MADELRESFKVLAADFVMARLAEMDAVLKVVEGQATALDSTVDPQAETCLRELRRTRVRMESAARAALEKNRDALTELYRDTGLIWAGFEQALKQWSEIGTFREDVLGAQLRAQCDSWDQTFDRYRSALAEPREGARDALVQRIEASVRRVTQFQMLAASKGSARWEDMTLAMARAREAAEKAAEEIQSALDKMKQ